MLKTCRAPSAGRRGKGARARSRGTSLCRTPRKGTSGQGLGGLLPAEHRGKGPPGKVSGDVSLPNAAERAPPGKVSGGGFPLRTPRKGTPGQGLGGLLSAERRGKRVVGQGLGVSFPCGSASASLFYAVKLRERGAFSCGAGFARERRFSSRRGSRYHAHGNAHVLSRDVGRRGAKSGRDAPFSPRERRFSSSRGSRSHAHGNAHVLSRDGGRRGAKSGRDAPFSPQVRRFISRRRIRGSRVRNRLQNISKNRKKVGKKVDTPRRLC